MKIEMKDILVHPSYFSSIVQMAAIVQASKVQFEIEDNYQKQSYRNRTNIAHSNGKLMLSIPIKHSKSSQKKVSVKQKTKDVQIENSFPWQVQHWKSLETAYRTSPFFEYYEDELKPLFFNSETSLMRFNLKAFDLICELLTIDIHYSFTESYEKDPKNNDLRFLINAKSKKKYTLKPYTQVLAINHGFLNNLSILDLLFNEGTNAIGYLESQQLDFI